MGEEIRIGDKCPIEKLSDADILYFNPNFTGLIW